MLQSFPKLLKHWRNTRRMSQLELGLAANVSARHVSFLETGRSMPSRSMVMHLCQTLEVPLPAQNSLLQAAGFAEVYRNRQWNDEDLALARQAVDWTLQRHDPYPAMALDKYWTIIKANRSASMLLNAVGMSEGESLLEAMQNSVRLKAAIKNWQVVLRHMIVRLRAESAKRGIDDVLTNAANQLSLQLEDQKAEPSESQAVLSTHYLFNGLELSLFSMLAQFSSVEDITLADLRVELMYPADQKTVEIINTLAQVKSSN